VAVIEAIVFAAELVGAAVAFTVAVDRFVRDRAVTMAICAVPWIGVCIGTAAIGDTIIGMV
jgi:hypothetical protein